MQNIDVRFTATSNFSKVQADLARLEAQAASLGAVFEKAAYAKPPGAVDPTRWRVASEAVHRASRVYRDAASSSGLLTTQQIRATSAAENYTKALQKQKLSFADMRKHQGIMKQVYQDQLRYQRMTAQYWGTDMSGRAITDITIPKNVPRDLDTAAQRMHFFGQMTKSASTQVINLGKNMQWAGRQLTVGFTYPIALFGAAAGAMAYKVEDAFGQINKVYDYSEKSLTNQTALVKEQAGVRAASMNMATGIAKQYGITISKTLDIEQQLAATGLTLKDGLVSATKEVARFSALGDIDPTKTTNMVIALQTAFKLKGDQLTKTLNFMNAASNATSLSLNDIAEATPRAATGIAQLGGTAEQMTIMLVSMREAGVDAAQGANALKSATTRIINPVKKATDFYDKYGISLDNLAKKSGGNLFKYLQLLGVEQQKVNGKNEKQTKLLRAQGVAALFGTYQNNRLTAALVNMADAYGGVQNQTKKALDLQGKSAEQLQHIADVSAKAMLDTPAAKLRKEWASFQITLAEMGKPFLDIAAAALKAAGAIGEFFNGLSSTSKHIIGIVTAVMALAGPLVMIVGLFFNLWGQFMSGVGKVASGIGRLLGAKVLLNKEEAAGIATAEAQNKAMMDSGKVMDTLAQEVQVLTLAYQRATQAAREFAEVQGLMAPVSQPAFIGPQTQTLGRGRGAYQLSSMEQTYFGQTPARNAMGQYNSNQARLDMARNRMAEDYMKSMNVVARDASLTEKYSAKHARTSATIKENLGGAAISGGVMAGSMALMMVSSNKTADNIAKWGMIGSLVVPALTGILTVTKAITVKAWEEVVARVAAARAAAADAGAVGLISAATATATGAAEGFAVALNAALGPIGWIALGITAIAGTFMIIKHHNDEIAKKNEEMLKQQKAANDALVNSSAAIAQNMGKAAGSYGQLTKTSSAITGNGYGQTTGVLKSYDYFKNSDEGKKAVTGLMSDGKLLPSTELMDKARKQFMDLQVIAGMSAKAAKDNLQGMLLAAGMSAKDASDMVDKVYKHLGDISKVKWARPVQDQIDALNNTAAGLVSSNMNVTAAGGMAVITYDNKVDPEAQQKLVEQAQAASAIFNQALQNAETPQEARKIMDQFFGAIQQRWNQGFKDLSTSTAEGSDKLRELFKKYGVTNGKTFHDAFMTNADFQKSFNDIAISGWTNTGFGNQMKTTTMDAKTFENTVIKSLSDSSSLLTDNLSNATTAMSEFFAAGVGLTAKQATDNLLSQNKQYKDYAATITQINELKAHGVDKNDQQMLDLTLRLQKNSKALLPVINDLNRKYGFKEGRTATQALNNLLNHTKATADDVANSVDNINKKLASMPTRQTVTIELKQIGGIMQSAMSATQNDMANSAMDLFNKNWDATMQHATDSQKAAQDRMQRQQQNAQDAFDARWQKRKDELEKEYQGRIDRINREIKAEQDADATRQRLFENEKARLQALADLENARIDFNTQLNTGQLDEAAKTLNNAQVKSDSDQMDREQKAAEARSQRKIDALQKKNDRLEKQKDREMKQLEKMEARMRKHLERVQAARSAALEKEQQQYMDSLQARRDAEEALLQQKLDLFKAFVPKNKRELDKWVSEVGLSWQDFGTNVLQQGKTWSQSFGDALRDHVLQAGMEVANDNMWQRAGAKMADSLLKGFGFKDVADFRRFVRTGTLTQNNKGGNNTETHHTGGVVGSGGGSRGNIPSTYKGLHRSEKMVRAQKGEYIVNRKAASEHMDLLHRINNGDTKGMEGTGGFSPGMGGNTLLGSIGAGMSSTMANGPQSLIAAAAGTMFMKGLTAAMNNAYQKGVSKQAVSGMFSGSAGTYGGLQLSAEQMKNAATIATVGSGMGMSVRDIEIGIMTAITESTLRNINYGDRDSLGLFQQRPSAGWGTPAQLTNPQYAASKFFSALRGVDGRSSMAPWLAAQAVQRSAFSDGSNYERWWAAAQAIFGKGLKRTKGGYNAVGGGYVPGAGGRHRPINGPVTNGLHDQSTGYPAVDFAGPVGRPVYAVSDGTVSRSYDIKGYEPRRPGPQDGYRSYGRVIYLRTDAGPEVLYAHLSKRSVAAGTRVKGGATLGYSGNTGNSTGAHLHFGATNGPYAWLRTGGIIKHDNTPAILHRGESVLTKALTDRFQQNVSNTGGDSFHVTLDLRGAMIKEDVDIKRAVNEAINEREKRVGRNRKVT